MLIDSHAHMNMSQFQGDLPAVLERAALAGVGEILNVGYDPASIDETIALADKYPTMYAALGIHPHHATDWNGYLEDRIKQLFLRRKVLAVGEIGLDYYRDLSPRDIQQDVFRRQIGLARQFGKPIIIHCREAFPDVIKIMKEEKAYECGGIFHAFSGGEEEAGQVLELGFLIGIGGPLTYPRSILPAVAERLPSSSFVLETDCPYLPPQAYRGKRNEPAYVSLVAEKLAEIRGVELEDIARAAEENFRKMFHGAKDGPVSIAYGLKRNIYINVTASCTNDCAFCTRLRSNNHLYGYNLNLLADPSVAEMVAAVEESVFPGDFREIVFCGYGEPTARLKAIRETAAKVKKYGVPLRLNTNGQGNLINRRNIVPELAEYFSSVSISLNAQDRETYMSVCKPDMGEKAFDAVLDFIRAAAASTMDCMVTALDYPDVDLEATRALVESIPGAKFRIRKYHFPAVAGQAISK
ncbi:MAG: YchF/TatD family DNA exonuclease [Candidatus Krumholzibacteria bacterium]|nr:YchF/TatD family DNA exonuclease [Candidatus Krumholzibacteria bacterium]